MTPDPVSQHLRDALDETDLARTFSAIRARLDAPKRSRLLPIGIAAAAVTIAGAALLALASFSFESGPIALDDGRSFAALDSNGRAELADGSRIETGEATRLDVLENGPRAVALHLRSGRARFEIEPGGERRWSVECEGVAVSVVGTVFTVTRRSDAVAVEVERGTVVVRGPGVPQGTRSLHAGETLVVPRPRAERAAPAGDDAVAEVVPPAEPASEPTRDETSELEASDPDALFAAADRARRSGRQAEAIALLRRIVSRHPRSAEGPIAAYTLAQLLEASGRDDDARAMYTRAIALGLPPHLATAAELHARDLDARSERSP